MLRGVRFLLHNKLTKLKNLPFEENPLDKGNSTFSGVHCHNYFSAC